MKRNDFEWLVSQIRNNYATLGRIEKMISNRPALPVQPVQFVQPVQPVQPVQFVQPVQPVQLVQPVADLGGRVQKGFEAPGLSLPTEKKGIRRKTSCIKTNRKSGNLSEKAF